jgi:hypothetical protein
MGVVMTFDSFNAVFFTAIFIVPGFVWSAVLSMFLARRSGMGDSRVLECFSLSCVNNAIWSWLLFLIYQGQWFEHRQVVASVGLFVVTLVSPVALGVACAYFAQTRKIAIWLHRWGFRTISSIPSAWDYFFSKSWPYWVIVTLKDGSHIYGLYGQQSFAGDEPVSRDLYLEATYHLIDDGQWAPTEDSAGIWLKADEIVSLEFRRLDEVNYE